ncbi:hypothetical protein C8R44DRAFT_896575 [Mycena epipterygia]|nr:hypothetical protein C8R44DRAFT_896575 [Mycena epipterygia]
MAGGNDPPRWVKSPHPPTNSTSDRTRAADGEGPGTTVPGCPPWTPHSTFLPPGHFADCDPMLPCPGSADGRPIVPMPPQPGPPLARMEPPRRAPDPTYPVQRAETLLAGMDPILTPAARDTAGHSPIRLRWRRDDDGHRVDEWRSDYARRGPDYPRREYDDRNRDDRDDRDYRSSSTRTLSPRAHVPMYEPHRRSKIRRGLSRFFANARSGPAAFRQSPISATCAGHKPRAFDSIRRSPARPTRLQRLPIYPEEPVPDDVSEYAGSDEESDEDTPSSTPSSANGVTASASDNRTWHGTPPKVPRHGPPLHRQWTPPAPALLGFSHLRHHGGSAVPTPLMRGTMSSGARHVPALDTLVWPPAPASAPRRYTIPNEGAERRGILLASGDHWRLYPTVAPTY